MPESYVPKHRNAPPKRVSAGAKKGARNAVLFSGAAMFATALSISAGVAAEDTSPDDTLVNLTAGKAQLTVADLAAREQSASRSSSRQPKADVLKAAELGSAAGVAFTRSEDLTRSDPRSLAKRLMSQYGLSTADFDCVDRLWSGESGWNVHAANPSSSAYGIPQALPGSKMASAGPNWQDNAETQIRWGLGYIANRYGSACAAWSYKQSHGWY